MPMHTGACRGRVRSGGLPTLLEILKRLGTRPPDVGEPPWLSPVAASLHHLAEAPGPMEIYCIANSEEVPIRHIRQACDPARALLCQYNKCLHVEDLRGLGAGSIFVFHVTGRNGQLHGCDAAGRPTFRLYDHPWSRACALLPVRDGMYRADGGSLSAAVPTFRLEAGPLRALFYAPDPSSTPSAGFATVLLFHLINLRRQLSGRPSHAIQLCGFTGVYAGGGYAGHDFHFEQQELRKLPNVSFLNAGADRKVAATRLHHDLSQIFHPAYDRSRARMLFDVARLHLAAGDQMSFGSFVKRAVARSPASTGPQWVMRALEAIPVNERGEVHPAPEFDELRRRWNTGFPEAEPDEAPPAEDLQHPQAGYSIRPTGRPRVLVVNETSRLDSNRWHLGCRLVSRQLRRNIAAIGAEYVGWANGAAGVSQILRHDPGAQFEGVIINGEGTLHHDADRAFEIGLVAEHFKGSGKKVFLINSVWEGNSTRLSDLFKGVDVISVRESRSQARLLPVRGDVRLVPDLCWLEEGEDAQASEAPVAVLDCVLPETAERLSALAAAAGLPAFVMSRFVESFNRAIAEGRPAADMPRVLRKSDIGRYRGWLGGRFHGMVLALGAGVPFFALASNTTKVEGMLDDIGLQRKMLGLDDLGRLRTASDVEGLFAGPHGYTEGDWERVRAYKDAARQSTAALFTEIADALV
jgi:hypothetical protein